MHGFRFLFLLATVLYTYAEDRTVAPDGGNETERDARDPADTNDAMDSLPKIVKSVDASYPDSIVARGVEGMVSCDLLVSENGTVDSVFVVKGLCPELDSAAVRALRSCAFSPALIRGKPVAVLLRYDYRFSLPRKEVQIPEYKNVYGTILERGTRDRVSRALVAVSFEDTVAPKKHSRKFICVDKTPGGIPLAQYLKAIGKFTGQNYEDGTLTTRTDSLGRFALYSLPCGTVRLKIVAAGYKTFTTSLVVKNRESEETKFRLERDSYNSSEIVVYGNAENKQAQRHDVDQPEMRRVAGFNGEAVKLIQAMPGAARPVFGGGELVIRGSDNSDSKVFIDGIEMPYLYHPMSFDFLMYRGIVNTDALKSVSLFSGGWGAEHGNAIAGIIDMQTRAARKDRWHGTLDLNIKGLNLLYEMPLGPNAGVIGSFRGNFLFDEIGFVKRHFFGEKSMEMRDFWDYSLRFDWKIAPSHLLTFTTIGANDTMYSFDPSWMKSTKHDIAREMQSMGTNLNMGIASWTWNISPNLENLLRYGITSSTSRTFENSSGDFGYDRGTRALRHYVRDELRLRIKDNLALKLGIDLRREPRADTNTFWFLDTVFTQKSNTVFGPLAGYATCEWKPVDKLTIIPGLRYDYYTQLDYHGSWLPEFWNYGDKTITNHTRFSGDPSFRVSGKYDLDAKRAITASAGNYNQSPDSTILRFDTKKGLVSEKGSQYTFGYAWNPGDVISLDCQGYFGRQWDKVRWKTSEERQNNHESFLATNGKARMEGLELMLRHARTDRFFGWLSYSLAYSERFDYGRNKWVEYDYNILNNLQLVANWFFRRNTGFGLRFQYTEGYPYTPYEVQYYDADNFAYRASAKAVNSRRHPAYFGLDLRFEKKWIFKRSMLTGYIEGERLFHLLQYVKNGTGSPVYHPGEMNQYNYDYSSFQSWTMFPMGSLGLTWEF